MKTEPIPPRLWRLLALTVLAMGGLYLLASPACDTLREAEARRHEEAQFSEP